MTSIGYICLCLSDGKTYVIENSFLSIDCAHQPFLRKWESICVPVQRRRRLPAILVQAEYQPK